MAIQNIGDLMQFVSGLTREVRVRGSVDEKGKFYLEAGPFPETRDGEEVEVLRIGKVYMARKKEADRG